MIYKAVIVKTTRANEGLKEVEINLSRPMFALKDLITAPFMLYLNSNGFSFTPEEFQKIKDRLTEDKDRAYIMYRDDNIYMRLIYQPALHKDTKLRFKL